MFKKNEGEIDRVVRIILAVLFFALAWFWLKGLAQTIFYILSAVSLITGIVGFCGVYKIFGISTYKGVSKIPKN